MRKPLRLPVAALVVLALVVAQAAVLAFYPESSGPGPVRVNPGEYFSSEFLRRADEFRSGQRWLSLAQLLVGLAAIAVIAFRPPALVRRTWRRPVLGGAAIGAVLAWVVAVAELPFAVAARVRAREVGLISQDWAGYAVDFVLGTTIAALTAAVAGMLVVVAMRRLRGRWWIAAAVVVTGYAVVLIQLSPVLIQPLFNDFERLPAGELRRDVVSLAERSGVDVGAVYVVDASKRTTGANAYVAGLGPTKRVVLYDNLLRDFERDEVLLIVAHELGHARYRDLPNGLLYLAIVAPVAAFAVAGVGARMVPGARRHGPGAIPAVALVAMTLSVMIGVVSNQLSRAVERRADEYSLSLTADPGALIAMQRRLTIRNVSDPDPPRIWHWIFGTHPPAVERIGLAEAYGEVRRPDRRDQDRPRRTPAGP